jgi:hypothetical protein
MVLLGMSWPEIGKTRVRDTGSWKIEIRYKGPERGNTYRLFNDIVISHWCNINGKEQEYACENAFLKSTFGRLNSLGCTWLGCTWCKTPLPKEITFLLLMSKLNGEIKNDI